MNLRKYSSKFLIPDTFLNLINFGPGGKPNIIQRLNSFKLIYLEKGNNLQQIFQTLCTMAGSKDKLTFVLKM